MAYDAETFQVLHGLTPQGERNYRDLLEREADRILFRHEHPVRYFLGWIASLFLRE